MRHVSLDHPAPCSQDLRPRLARLTRHLRARLLDFGPGGPQVRSADQAQGRVEADFPGHDTAQVLSALARCGVSAARAGDEAVFWLTPDTPFEDLDYVWGCLFDILG